MGKAFGGVVVNAGGADAGRDVLGAAVPESFCTTVDLLAGWQLIVAATRA
jgi:hypothetical protein